MKIQRDKLHQYQRRITVLTDKETDIAKQMLAKGDKQRALLALRRKKYQESLLTKTDAQLEQLEKLTSSVEFALIQKDVVFGLQQGTKVLKDIHTEMGGIEHVEKLMGETADAIAYQKVGVPNDAAKALDEQMLTGRVGSQRNAWRSHIESRRGRGGRRTGSPRGRNVRPTTPRRAQYRVAREAGRNRNRAASGAEGATSDAGGVKFYTVHHRLSCILNSRGVIAFSGEVWWVKSIRDVRYTAITMEASRHIHVLGLMESQSQTNCSILLLSAIQHPYLEMSFRIMDMAPPR